MHTKKRIWTDSKIMDPEMLPKKTKMADEWKSKQLLTSAFCGRKYGTVIGLNNRKLAASTGDLVLANTHDGPRQRNNRTSSSDILAWRTDQFEVLHQVKVIKQPMNKRLEQIRRAWTQHCASRSAPTSSSDIVEKFLDLVLHVTLVNKTLWCDGRIACSAWRLMASRRRHLPYHRSS